MAKFLKSMAFVILGIVIAMTGFLIWYFVEDKDGSWTVEAATMEDVATYAADCETVVGSGDFAIGLSYGTAYFDFRTKKTEDGFSLYFRNFHPTTGDVHQEVYVKDGVEYYYYPTGATQKTKRDISAATVFEYLGDSDKPIMTDFYWTEDSINKEVNDSIAELRLATNVQKVLKKSNAKTKVVEFVVYTGTESEYEGIHTITFKANKLVSYNCDAIVDGEVFNERLFRVVDEELEFPTDLDTYVVA